MLHVISTDISHVFFLFEYLFAAHHNNTDPVDIENCDGM